MPVTECRQKDKITDYVKMKDKNKNSSKPKKRKTVLETAITKLIVLTESFKQFLSRELVLILNTLHIFSESSLSVLFFIIVSKID